jgi:hypothetical protein
MTKFTNKLAFATLVTASVFTTNLSAQQLKVPAPSSTQTVKQTFALSEINLEYSRPSAKGRVVFGEVVPFGKIWRTGANQATKITFGDDVKIEGKDLKAGTYALYTIPGKEMWEIMFYKDLTMGGNVANYKTEDEVLRVSVKAGKLTETVETFTIDFESVLATSLSVDLKWEKTKVSFKVTEDIDAKVMKNIETSLAADSRPYFQAATYYYDTDKDLTVALDWVNKAIAANPKGFWMLALKAKIQNKQKDYKGATATAQSVVDLATEAKNDDYVAIGKKIIADSKGK